MDLQKLYKNSTGKNHLSFEPGFFPSGTYSNDYVNWLVSKLKNLAEENRKMHQCLEILSDAQNNHQGMRGHDELELVEHTAKECLKSLKQ